MSATVEQWLVDVLRETLGLLEMRQQLIDSLVSAASNGVPIDDEMQRELALQADATRGLIARVQEVLP